MKRSITLDVTTPEGRQIALIHWSKVFAARSHMCADNDDERGADYWGARAADYAAIAKEGATA